MVTEISQKYTIRSYDGADEEQVLNLMRLSLGESVNHQRSSDFWRWKHSSSPFGPSYVRVACAEDGQLVGMRAFQRWEFNIGGRELKAVRAVDTATHPGFRRMGVFSALTQEVVRDVARDGVDLIFNTPNQEVLPGYLKLGWTHVTRVQPRIKVLNYSNFALGLVRDRLGKQSSRNFSPAELFRLKPRQFRDILGKPQAVESLVRKDSECSGAQGIIRTHRSIDYLEWRYANHPFIPYWTVTVDHGHDLLSCAIFRTNTRYGLREVVLSELLLAESDVDLALETLKKIKACVRADFLISEFPLGSTQRLALDRSGFRTAPKQGINFAVKALAEQLPLNPLKFENWGLTIGDIELL